MKKVLCIGVALLSILSFGYGFAQESMTQIPAVITYLVGNVDVDNTPDNNVEDFQIAELDMKLPRGAIVRTGRDGLCELSLHDGSTIKLSNTSVFKIEDISYNEDSGRKRSKFNLMFGKMKATVAKLTTSDSEFDVRSGTALAGVRGTTYGIFFDGVQAQVLVFDGSVSLESITGAFEPQIIKKGKFSTIPSDGLAESATRIPEEVWQEWDEEFSPFSDEAEEIVEEQPEEKPKTTSDKGEKKINLGATFGSLTIEDTFFNRWAFLTEYKRGKFGFGLYLPAIFLPDNGLFSFKEWYNYDEWDFTDFNDAIHDLLVKIYYLQYGRDGDPFFFRLGGLERVRLYQGFIVNEYTNMLYFPQEVSTGVVLNADLHFAGIESFIAHVDRGLQTSAVRGYLRPLGRKVPLSIGGTMFYDWPKPDSASWPMGPLGEQTQNEEQLPRIFIVGLDTGFPVTQLDSFTMEIYVDAAKIGYQYDELQPALAGTGVNAGKIEFLEGFGTALGVAGTVVSMVDYRAEYRYIRDYYEPGIIDFNWDNRRLTYQQELLNLILAQNDPSYASADSSGFYLSGGVRLFDLKLAMGLGYGQYNRYTGTSTENVEEGQIYIKMEEGLIPKTWGQITYDRSNNFSSIFKEPFDESTLFNVDIFYQVAPLLTLSLKIKRTYQYDDEAQQWRPIDSFGINTMISF
jgi:hypothetical protein